MERQIENEMEARNSGQNDEEEIERVLGNSWESLSGASLPPFAVSVQKVLPRFL